MNERTVQDTCLFFGSGLPLVDNYEMTELLRSGVTSVVYAYSNGDTYDWSYSQYKHVQLESRGHPRHYISGRALSIGGLISVCKAHNVTWFAANAHCANAFDLALVGDALDINHPHSSLVHGSEDKGEAYETLDGVTFNGGPIVFAGYCMAR